MNNIKSILSSIVFFKCVLNIAGPGRDRGIMEEFFKSE